MPGVEADLARRVAAALLSLPHEGELARRMKIVGFTIPGDYRSIDELLRQLRLPPFEKAPQFTFADVMQRFQPHITLGGMAFILLLALALLALLLLNRRLRLERNRVASSEARQRGLFQALGEGVLGCDLDARCTFVNEKALTLLGYSESECLGRDVYRLLHGDRPNRPAAGEMRRETLQAALLGRRALVGEETLHRRDGSSFPAAFVITPLREKDQITGSVLVFSDIAARKAAEARIQHLAYYDELTGLPNRCLLIEMLGQALASVGESQRRALVLLNVDRFKVINNARGSDTGDALLAAIAARLAGALRESDRLARLAADEFAILVGPLEEADDERDARLERYAESLHARLEWPFNLKGETFRIRASLGVALFPAIDQDSPDAILLRAETALRRAKAGGGNQSVVFAADMAETAAQDYRLERELRHAIGNGELRLFLQPQVHADGHMTGAEVLVRWQHPSRGLLAPGLFIPIAEESDLIVELGSWVLSESAHLLANAEMSGLPLRLSVNISPRHFRQAGFVPWVRDVLAASGADPRRLTLEITESLVIDNLDDVVAKMEELAALGIRLSIDDFGTGYSSLTYLKRLPLHELKIDRAFVRDAASDPDDAALVRTILAIAAQMNLDVVAEGVETSSQAEFLSHHASVVHQGYYYGYPEPAEIWLARWRLSTRAGDWNAGIAA
jgi:diguanylate cyclase (GGDEF)-like protein/PAS domain S-box-containing protein